jgi:hypothetical protein
MKPLAGRLVFGTGALAAGFDRRESAFGEY